MDNKFILLYNPKHFEKREGARVIRTINKAKVTDMYGARENGRENGKLVEKPALYSIKPGEIKKFRLDIGSYLLKKFGFLEEVKPDDLDKKLKEIAVKKYHCDLCDFESDSKGGLEGHRRSHRLSEDAKKILDTIPEATPDGYVVGAEYSRSGKTEIVSADEAEGIPITRSNNPSDSVEDNDGVGWYGEGKQEDRRVRRSGGMSSPARRNTPGMGAAL